jgi:hypothetical protein
MMPPQASVTATITARPPKIVKREIAFVDR